MDAIQERSKTNECGSFLVTRTHPVIEHTPQVDFRRTSCGTMVATEPIHCAGRRVSRVVFPVAVLVTVMRNETFEKSILALRFCSSLAAVVTTAEEAAYRVAFAPHFLSVYELEVCTYWMKFTCIQSTGNDGGHMATLLIINQL